MYKILYINDQIYYNYCELHCELNQNSCVRLSLNVNQLSGQNIPFQAPSKTHAVC